MADDQENRIAALEAKVQELDALVSLALPLLSINVRLSRRGKLVGSRYRRA